nr:MAG TPA: hypothetical protein [Caudoviricetes sp.]
MIRHIGVIYSYSKYIFKVKEYISCVMHIEYDESFGHKT